MGWLRKLGEFLRGFFLHNVLLKLVSIAVAFGLWFFVNAAQRDSEAEYPIAVRLNNLPVHLLLVSPRPETVDLHLSGPRTLLNRIEGSNIAIEVDLSRVRAGATTFRLRSDTLPLPRGVTPIRITPSELTLEFDRIEGKRILVELAVDGRPAGDLRITESKVTPEEVEVRGPSRVVRDITVAKPEPLRRDGRDSSWADAPPLPVGASRGYGGGASQQAYATIPVHIDARCQDMRPLAPERGDRRLLSYDDL